MRPQTFQRVRHPKVVGAEARLSQFYDSFSKREGTQDGTDRPLSLHCQPHRTSLSPVSSADLQNAYSIIESWLTMKVSMATLKTGIPS